MKIIYFTEKVSLKANLEIRSLIYRKRQKYCYSCSSCYMYNVFALYIQVLKVQYKFVRRKYNAHLHNYLPRSK